MSTNLNVTTLSKVITEIEKQDGRKRPKIAKRLQRMIEAPENNEKFSDSDLFDIVGKARLKMLFQRFMKYISNMESAPIASAIYRWKILGEDERCSFLETGARISWLRELEKLQNLSGLEIGNFTREIKGPNIPEWAARTIRSQENIKVVIQWEAAFGMLLAAIETYRVKPKGKKKPYTEMYGLCIGHTKPEINNLITVNIERFIPQLRSENDYESCEPNQESNHEIVKLFNKYNPEKNIVGECHTHPYDSYQKMIKIDQPWKPSKEDLVFFKNQYTFWQCKGHTPEVSVIIAVAKKRKSKDSKNPQRFGLHTQRRLVGNCEIIFAAHRMMRDGKIDTDNPKKLTLDVKI